MLPIKPARYVIRTFRLVNGKVPFVDWLRRLDGSVRARINARIARFEDGHFGDHKAVGDGVYEARLFFGPGYRVYFHLHSDEIIVLLIGGDKSTQSEDVQKAKEFLRIYWEDQDADKEQ